MHRFFKLHGQRVRPQTTKAVPAAWIILASSWLLLAAILFVVIREHSFDTLVDVWDRSETGPFVFAILAMIAIQAIGAWRQEVIMRADGLDGIDFWPLFRIQLVSQFAAYGAPISALSDLAKAAMVKLRFALGPGRSIRLVLYDRICGATGIIIIGVLAVFGQMLVATPPTLMNAQILLWAAGGVGVAMLVVIGEWQINSRVEVLDRTLRAIIGLGHILRRPVIAAKLLLASSGLLLGFCVVFSALAYGMQIQVSLLQVFLFMPLIFFVSALPVFYQGWGGREAIVIATIGSTGQVTSAEAIALSIAFGVAAFLASLPGLVLWIMRPSMRKVARVEAE